MNLVRLEKLCQVLEKTETPFAQHEVGRPGKAMCVIGICTYEVMERTEWVLEDIFGRYPLHYITTAAWLGIEEASEISEINDMHNVKSHKEVARRLRLKYML